MSFKQEGNHYRNADTHLLDGFYVIAMISNPIRFGARYRLYEQFKKHMAVSGVKLITVEVGFGDRKHQVTEVADPNHIQLRTYDELWHKENAINIAVSRLPADWQYVAWIDADIKFLREDWAIETVHQLQHHMIVQLWQTANLLGPANEITNDNTIRSFAYCYKNNVPTARYDGRGSVSYGTFWHPGFAWAMRREAWDHLGGLLDVCVLGAADYHMAYALIGKVQGTLEWSKENNGDTYHPNYKAAIMAWQERAETFIKRDIGFVPGTILHHWHGKAKDRKYNERWKTLVRHKFDPLTDIKRDWQGLYQLNPLKWGLRDELRAYARDRNEDSIDTQ